MDQLYPQAADQLFITYKNIHRGCPNHDAVNPMKDTVSRSYRISCECHAASLPAEFWTRSSSLEPFGGMDQIHIKQKFADR